MSKVTISDFIIALADLVEAESRALQESASRFLHEQKKTLAHTAYRSGWTVAWIFASVITLLGAVVFVGWGVYGVVALYVSKTAAPFIVGGVLLLLSLLFAVFARNKGKLDV
jgi:fatty acid desaturase